MSYILQALERSERQRQQRQNAGDDATRAFVSAPVPLRTMTVPKPANRVVSKPPSPKIAVTPLPAAAAPNSPPNGPATLASSSMVKNVEAAGAGDEPASGQSAVGDRDIDLRTNGAGR